MKYKSQGKREKIAKPLIGKVACYTCYENHVPSTVIDFRDQATVIHSSIF